MNDQPEEKTNGEAAAGTKEGMENMKMPVTVHAQYIKDLSVENPHAPLSLKNMTAPPQVEMSVNVGAKQIEDKEADRRFHEVVLSMTMTARHEDKIAMIVEIDYGLACTVHDMTKEQLHPFLLIEMPHMMFPFVRQIVAELTAHAGFNPIYLTPVNFRSLYLQRFGKGVSPSEGQPQEQSGQEDEGQDKEKEGAAG